jgi:hypothetical protein
MNVLEIVSVSHPRPDPELLWQGRLDRPKAGDVSESLAIEIQGWIMGKSAPVSAISLISGGVELQRVPLNMRRPAIAARYPESVQGDMNAFTTILNAVRLSSQFEIRLQAQLADGAKVGVGMIRGRRAGLRTSFEPALWPVLMTTVGRTGSARLAAVLSRHPSIVAFRPTEFEARATSYWMEVLKTLSDPRSYLNTIMTEPSGELWWTESSPPPLARRLVDGFRQVGELHPELGTWLGRDHPEAVAAFCQERIDAFYREVASVQDRTKARYFLEKFWPDRYIPSMIWELYPDAREILLVRDFRDMVCSIREIKAKRGSSSFGPENVRSDEQSIRQVRTTAVRMLQSWQERSDRAHLIRYEDLIAHPEPTLSSALHYLGVDSSPQTVGRMLEEATELIPRLVGADDTSQDPKASIGRWRVDLDRSLQETCQEAFGDSLRKFGYEDGFVRTRQQLGTT